MPRLGVKSFLLLLYKVGYQVASSKGTSAILREGGGFKEEQCKVIRIAGVGPFPNAIRCHVSLAHSLEE